MASREPVDAPDGTAARPVPFETFREAVERFHYGFVLTAHPTFSLNADQNRALSDLAWAIAEERDCTQPRHALWETLRTPFVPPDLDTENAQALEAARRIREAVGTLRQIALEVAARHYPLEWTALRPTLCSVATWVGFDLDGRSDIVWSGILARRLLLQTLQIEELIRHLDTLPSLIQAARSPVAQAQACLNTALDQARGLRDLFASYDPDRDPDHAALQASSRAMIANASARMIRPDRVVALLEEALALEPSPAGQMGLVGVLSALRAEGGAFAQVHFRVNAVQIHNAIRKHVDLTTHPADPRFRQTYLERIGRLLAGARPCPVHFGTILEEQASARRLFMIVQQIVKHVDAASPIRFLIAETESALTVLGALYLARRFGVEDHVDLCPLFETERALEDGAHIVQTLLESPDFVAWVRQRGRLCIQTGYSDAGRYIGQIPACGTIERLKARICLLYTSDAADE